MRQGAEHQEVREERVSGYWGLRTKTKKIRLGKREEKAATSRGSSVRKDASNQRNKNAS